LDLQVPRPIAGTTAPVFLFIHAKYLISILYIKATYNVKERVDMMINIKSEKDEKLGKEGKVQVFIYKN
jgi:hypothetical protein